MNEKITIKITNLRHYANHGVMAQERVVGNEFSISLTLRLGAEALEGASRDDIEQTVNYAEVINLTKQVMAEPAQLLENVVWRLRDMLLERFPLIEGGKIGLVKLTPPCGVEVDGVGVELDFTR